MIDRCAIYKKCETGHFLKFSFGFTVSIQVAGGDNVAIIPFLIRTMSIGSVPLAMIGSPFYRSLMIYLHQTHHA